MSVADFQKLQYEFTQHLRDPSQHAKPDHIEDRRMAVYRDLLFNNVKTFIDNTFPVLHSLYREEAWLKLVRAFFSTHQSHSPYFTEISQEFLSFLQNEYQPTAEDPDFMLELAHYEWVELALVIAKDDIDLSLVNPHGHLLDEVPVISSLVMPLAYQWDVQHISKDYRPEAPPEQPTYLIVHRDKEDEVHFTEANPVTARLVSLLQEDQDKTGRHLLTQISEELQHPDPDMVVQGGHQIMLKLRKSEVLLGTKSA